MQKSIQFKSTALGPGRQTGSKCEKLVVSCIKPQSITQMQKKVSPQHHFKFKTQEQDLLSTLLMISVIGVTRFVNTGAN